MMRMPLYFILSGLFFKDYGGFLEHSLKKINKILVPFLFFYVIAYIPFYIFEYWKPGLIKTSATGLLDLFNNRNFFNGPIWFLLTLFWANLMFCLISLNIKSEYGRGLVTILIGLVGLILGKSEIFLPLFLDVAMSALPYFYIGYILNKTPILYPNKYDRYNLLIALGAYLVAYAITVFCNEPHMSFHYNKMYGNVFLNYIGSFTCVIAILFVCKIIKHLPVVSYCGRYSIILLCLHHMIYRPVILGVNKLGLTDQRAAWVTAIVTITICIGMIPVCKKLIPWFVAQKDLIKSPVKNKR